MGSEDGQAGDGDAEGVIEYSRGQSALFARRPRSSTSIKGMHPEGVRHESRKYFFGEDRLGSILGKSCCTPTGGAGRFWGKSTGGAAQKTGSTPGISLVRLRRIHQTVPAPRRR